MGGQKGDRKSYKATSSAKAAEALAAKGAAVGFGGFSGVRPVAGFGFGAPAAASGGAAGAAAAGPSSEPLELSAQLDGDLAQCLRHLSKRDTTTKMKALQSLRELVPQKSAAELALLLQPWAYQFKRLLLDPAKSVRAEATAIMAAIGSSVGKALLPQLKSLLGPWWLACFDPYPDAAAAAKRSLADVFPGKKQADVLLYCRAEVLEHIISCLNATPQTLGDATKDSPEELQERHERINAAALAAAAALLTTLQQQQAAAAASSAAAPAADAADAGATSAASSSSSASQAATSGLQDSLDRLAELLQAGFFKKHVAAKSPLVRRAGYSLVAVLCNVAPQLLGSCQAAAAPVVLGALQDKEPTNHPAMWEMLLAFAASQRPACWAAVNIQKAFMPRLLALLRHGCFGSAPSSLPALLPLVSLLPRSALGPQPVLLLDQVLEGLWMGLSQVAGSAAARAATAAAYQEVLIWGLRNAAALAAGGGEAAAALEASSGVAPAAGEADAADAAQAARQYCEQLLLQGHFSSLVSLALSGAGPDASLAAGIVHELLLGQCTAAAGPGSSSGGGSAQLPMQLDVLLTTICSATQKQLTAAVAAAAASAAAEQGQRPCRLVCSCLQQLFDAMSESAAAASTAAGERLAGCCCATLLPLLQAGQPLPEAASNLLSRLIYEFPAAAGAASAAAGSSTASAAAGTSSSIPALVRLGLTSCAAGQLPAADAGLLLSCLAGSADPAAAWGDVLASVADTGPSVAGLRFLDALLRRAVSSSSSGSGSSSPAAAGAAAAARQAGFLCHPGLDSLVLQLLQRLSAAGGSADAALQGGPRHGSSSSSSWGLTRGQAAAAALLGCCLGANDRQLVLLSRTALADVVSGMTVCLKAARAAQLQQQLEEEQAAAAAAEAATVCVAALHMALVASSHSSSSSSSSSVWGQQPQQVVQLLLLVWQQSWGTQQELLLPDLSPADDDDDEQQSSGRDSGSSSGGSNSSSEEELPSDDSEAEQQGQDAAAAGTNGDSAASLQAVSSSDAAWRSLQQAAARVWGPELVSTALDELPAGAGGSLVQELQRLLVQGLAAAAAAAAAGDADGSGGAATAAAVEAGLRWASRAAAVLEALDERQLDQQQQLLHELLLVSAPGWQRWCSTDGQWHAPQEAGAVGSPGHALMLQFCSTLLLQVGAGMLMPLQAVSAAAEPGSSRQWLLLELLCSATCLSATDDDAAATGENASSSKEQAALLWQRLQHCVPAAAAAAQRHVLRAAGSSSAAGSSARSLLGSSLSLLLAAARATAASAAAGEPAGVSPARVFCSTLVGVLQQAVALCAARPSAGQQLLPVLQTFCSSSVAASASSFTGGPASSSLAAAPAWVLVDVLAVLAAAFRARGEDCVAAAGLDKLAVGFAAQAMALEPSCLVGSSNSSTQLELLQLAVACFPVRFDHQQHQHHSHHHAGSSQQLSAGSSTAAERQAVAALLRHVCSSSSQDTAGAEPASSAAAELVCRLQLCCVSYCWADMGASEWHVVLRDSQQQLTAARRQADKAAGALAAAACSAAQQIAGGGAAADPEAPVMMPAVAIEVLRRLARRGLLQRQAALTGQLVAAAEAAVAGLPLAMLQLGLQLLSAVLQLQHRIQAAGRAPQLDLALASAWRELLAFYTGVGAAVAVATACGPAVAGVLQHCLDGQAATWQLLGSCLAASQESDAVGKVLAVADDRLEMLGVDGVGCCLALLSPAWGAGHHHPLHQPAACEPLQQLAWQMLLHPDSLARITHAAAAGSSDEEVPEFGVSDDPAAFLMKVGLRPEMAAGLTSPRPWQPHLLHWSLLLAHIAQLPARSNKAQRRLTQALRDVPELVPELLERVAGLMGLGGSKSTAAAAAADDAGDAASGADIGSSASAPTAGDQLQPGAGAALSAAAQASLSAKLQQVGSAPHQAWALATAARNIGLPATHSSWRLLAAAVYRAVLCTLPASARLWFSDLRDRSRIAAVEAYTTQHESPALLAAEFAAIKRDAAHASGEVGGGSCSFRVRASQAAREVTAVLEIEDGATLELQVKLPAAAPLRAAEVDCRNKVGIKDGRLRKWLLSIAVFLRNQNSGVLDAIGLWKANLDQEFAGVQPCLICYSVISAVNGQLPRLSCRQCSVTFHPACLYKWFRSSGKSTCPHCQGPW